MKFFTFIIALFITIGAFAAPVRRLTRDSKLPTQQLIEKQTITNPAAAATDNGLDDNAGNTSAAAASVSSFDAQPDVARNVVITPGGTTDDVAACTITVSGTNYFDQNISEDFAFLANASTATTGAYAFKTITGVSFPAACEDSPFGATWDLGYGEKIGFKRCMDAAGHYVFSTVAGAYESTRGTVVADNDEVHKNTIDFNGTMNGSNDFEVFFIQSFDCFP